MLPEEYAFVLPDGRSLRVYEHGVQEEEPDGMPTGRGFELSRPQHGALCSRIGGNPHGYGAHTWLEYVTATAVEVILPERLAWMDDDDLVELAHAIHQKVVELEMTADAYGAMVAETVAEEYGPDAEFAHLIDLTAAGPVPGQPSG